MTRYLLDTNIFIYYFNGDAVVQPLFANILAGNHEGYYCPLTWIELLCYPALTPSEANQIRAFLRRLSSVTLTETILDSAAQIRQSYRLKLPDAAIAACAFVQGYTLVTRNIADFHRIIGLALYNPFNP